MATEALDIRVREDGSVTVNRRLVEIGNSAEKSGKQVDVLQQTLNQLKKMAAGLGVAFGFSQFARLTGVWTDMNSRLRLVAGSTENATAVLDRLQQMAKRSYASIETTTESYLGNAAALNELGYSTLQQLDFTEALTNALVISGAKGERAETVMNALSKAMMQGKLSGINWTTVLQQGGYVVEALAAGMGKSIQELRRMASGEGISADTMFTALTSQLERLRAEADAMPATIADAMTVLGNRVLEMAGQLDEATGFSATVVKAIDFLGAHLETIVKLLASVAIGMAVAFGPNVIGVIEKATGAALRFAAAIAANPVGAIAVALTTVIAALVLFRDQITIVSDGAITLGDYMRAVWEMIASGISTVVDFLRKHLGAAIDWVTKQLASVNVAWSDIWDFTKTIINRWIGLQVGAARAIMMAFKGLPSAIAGDFVTMFNLVIGTTETAINKIVGAINAVGTKLGLPEIAQVQLTRMENTFAGGTKQLGQTVSAAFKESFNADYIGGAIATVGKGLDALTAKARKFAQARQAAEKNKPAVDLNAHRPKPTPVEDPEALKKFQSEWASFLGKVDPVKTALADIAKAEELVTQAIRRGVVSRAEANRLMGEYVLSLTGLKNPMQEAQDSLAKAEAALDDGVRRGYMTREQATRSLEAYKAQLQDQLDPLGAVTREMDKQEKLLRMEAGARALAAQVMDAEAQLRQKGLSEEEIQNANLGERIQRLNELARVTQVKDQLVQQMVGPQQVYNDTQAALNQLLAEGVISAQDFASAMMDLRMSVLQSSTDVMDGFERGFLRVYDQLGNMAQLSEELVTRSFQSAEDSIVDFVTKGEVSMRGLLNVVLETTTRMLVRFLMLKAFGALGGPFASFAGAGGGGGGGSLPGFATGGEFTVGGSGGTDSQLVAFRATPGEQVSVRTPGQQDAAVAPVTNVEVPVKVINVTDPKESLSALQSAEGERIIMNVIEKNPKTVQRLLNR